MKLSIIINHYRTPEILKICLKSLKKSLSEADFSWEIIVSDGATIEKTAEMMEEQFPEEIFIPFEKNVGFGKLVNAGIEKSQGEFLFIINADIIVEGKNTIPVMIEYLKKNEDVGLLGPQLLNINDTVQQSCFRFYTPLVVLCRRTFLGRISWGRKILNNFLMGDIFDQKNITKPIPADWLMGSAFMMKKSVVEEVGGLDEIFFMYFEDVDWARRFWEKGYRVIYFPEAKMYHYHFQSSKKKGGIKDLLFNKYTRIHLASAWKYFKKYRFKNVKYGL
ncbi:glycosyltransferase family 2 protein [Candidatus Parcubacteria bacterium]|nr:glycosyltransferase family 2 protein [Candidatus Parcubacteria bacterium]